MDVIGCYRRTSEKIKGPASKVKAERFVSIEANELLECFQWSDTEYDLGEVYVVSPYGWVFGFDGGIRIISPEDAVTEMKRMAENVLVAEERQ